MTDEGSNDVSVVDLGSQKVTATIPVGNAPRKIAVQSGPTALTAGIALGGGPSKEQPKAPLGAGY